MKNFLFIILIVVGCYWGYTNYEQNVPVDTRLTNLDGNTMDIVLLSRGGGQIKFRRANDGQYFSYRIKDLSLISKCKVYWYMRESASAASAASAASGSGEVADLYWQGMVKQMAELNESVRLLGYELAAAETGGQRRALHNEMAEGVLKINKLKLKMEEFQSRAR